jgi:hypothetical protein
VAESEVITKLRCAALGCQSAPGKNGAFCAKDWKRLPPALQGPAAVKDAVVHLGKVDGYLVEAKSVRPVKLTDNAGTEYV